MLNYNDELEEIRKGLDFQYFFNETPGLKKIEAPPGFASLDKEFECISDLPLSEKVKKGQKLIDRMVDRVISSKLTLTQNVYHKLQELTMFYCEKWIVPEIFPLQKKENEKNARSKARAEARKNGIKPDKSPEELLYQLADERFQEENERRERFIKFYDLLYSKKDLIKDLSKAIKDSKQEINLPSGWWMFDRISKLFEAVAQHKKDENSDEDKAHIVDLLGYGTMAKSLYWNLKYVEEKLEDIRVELFGISDDLFGWRTEKEREEFCSKEDEQAIEDLNFVLEAKYSKYIHTEFNFYHNALMIWDAEQMLARELKTVEPIVSLPDKIRENLQKLMYKAGRIADQNDKLLTVKEIADHYNLKSTRTVYSWKEKGAPFHGTKARISELDQWFDEQRKKRSEAAQEREQLKKHKRTSKK